MKKIAVIPNRGGGIGHQFCEWLYGYIFCKNNKIQFFHYDFIGHSSGMDKFFNLAYEENEYKDYRGLMIAKESMSIDEYLQSSSEDLYIYDFYDEQRKLEVTNEMLIDPLIREILRHKFYKKHEYITLDTISIHIRTKRSVSDQDSDIRYFKTQYFINNLERMLKTYPDFKIRIFSEHFDESFNQFLKFNNVSFCINESLEKTFYEMIHSKILITSNSGISFISTLISDKNNIKICPNSFWHEWPKECIINII